MRVTPHHTYVFRGSTDAEIAVEVWPDGIDVKVRPDSSAIWGLPLKRVSEDGAPVQFAFGGEISALQELRDEKADWEEVDGG